MSNRALIQRFSEWCQAGDPMVLATVIHTEGSTYSKAGRQILISADGQYVGLVSGGCLEGDLAEHARAVIQTGVATSVTYDMRTEADDLWGMGLGCSGMLRILLQRLTRENSWQPFSDLAAAMAATTHSLAALAVASTIDEIPVGTVYLRSAAGPWTGILTPPELSSLEQLPCNARVQQTSGVCELLYWAIHPWPRLLLLGAGPDTHPVLEIARALGWEVTVADHRTHYIAALPAGMADHTHSITATKLGQQLALANYTAVVVMSHHLDTDRTYLQQLAEFNHEYVGLLGPLARKTRLLEELGIGNTAFAARLRGPVGLAIGADSPASISLAVLAEIQAVVNIDRQTSRSANQ